MVTVRTTATATARIDASRIADSGAASATA
jgi:hypothetical protein